MLSLLTESLVRTAGVPPGAAPGREPRGLQRANWLAFGVGGASLAQDRYRPRRRDRLDGMSTPGSGGMPAIWVSAHSRTLPAGAYW
jgi:hypothetical protein